MPLNNGISVRLEPAIRDRLEAIAQRFGIRSSVLIRLAVLEKLDSIESEAALIFKVQGARPAPLPPPGNVKPEENPPESAKPPAQPQA